VYNPASGWLATANNRMVDDRYPYVLTKHWAPAYRFNRIRTLLEARKTFTAVDMTQIQTDTYSYPDAALAKEIVKTIQKARVRSADEELVLNELDVWDGHVRRSSLAATLTWYTRIALEELILRSKLGDKLAGSYRWMQSPVFLQELLQSQDPSWLPTRTVKISLDSPETFQSRLITGYEDLKRVALAIAMSYLRREYGQTPGDKWRWGVANSMQFAHPLGKIWPLNQLLNSPRIELEGNSWTVSVNRPDFGASMRLVVDFSDTSKTYLHITTGQSGHFRSHHYLDQLPLWNSGRVISLSQSDRIAQSSGGTLKLIPFPMR
jgi:penicillin amidase